MGFLCFAFLGQGAHAEPKRNAALVAYGTAADDVEPDVRASLSQLSGLNLRDKASTQADVAAAAELGTSCSAEAIDCLGSLAVLLRVDVLVVLRANGRAEGVAIEMFTVDAARGEELARERTMLARESDAATNANAVRDVVESVIEPHHFGSITVNAPASSTVRVNDNVVAASERVRIRAGSHRVDVELAGHEAFTAAIEVVGGQDVVVEATLTPLQPQGGAAATPAGDGLHGGWIIAGSGAAIVVVGSAVALGIDAGLAAGLGNAEEKEGYQALGVMGLVVASTGAVVALTGMAIALLTD